MATKGELADGEERAADKDGLSIDEYHEYQKELNQRFLQSVSSD